MFKKKEKENRTSAEPLLFKYYAERKNRNYAAMRNTFFQLTKQLDNNGEGADLFFTEVTNNNTINLPPML